VALYTDFITAATTNIDASAINNSITNILSTSYGSVPGMPTFGTRLNGVLFSQMDSLTISIIQDQIREALSVWEPRITVTDVIITAIPEFNKIVAVIDYNYIDKQLSMNEQISVSLVK